VKSPRHASGAQAVERILIERLVKTYARAVALRGVTASLEAGVLTIIEGPNGSGKSTLLGILGTVVKPTSGTVSYEPVAVLDVSGAARGDLGTVRSTLGWLSHETLAYPDLSGRQNVELAAALHGLDPGHAWARAKARFDLGPFAERPVRTCSRGQRQRVALARALVHGPSVVLLDEPTAGLDRSGVDRLLEVVRGEVEGGAIVAVVTHEPQVFDALDVPRERLCLDRGAVVAP
jgi:heme exporter protein A